MLHSNPEDKVSQHKTISGLGTSQEQARTLALQLAHISTVYIQLSELRTHGKLLHQNDTQSQSSVVKLASDKSHQSAASIAHTAQPGQCQNFYEPSLERQAQHISLPCNFPYQQELVDVILKKKNTILFLPSGDRPNFGSCPTLFRGIAVARCCRYPVAVHVCIAL